MIDMIVMGAGGLRILEHLSLKNKKIICDILKSKLCINIPIALI